MKDKGSAIADAQSLRRSDEKPSGPGELLSESLTSSRCTASFVNSITDKLSGTYI